MGALVAEAGVCLGPARSHCHAARREETPRQSPCVRKVAYKPRGLSALEAATPPGVREAAGSRAPGRCRHSAGGLAARAALQSVHPINEPHVVDLFGAPFAEGVVAPRAARQKAPPVMPAVMTPSGPSDLITAFFRNRIIFVGSPVNGQVAQRVISQLITLAAIDENEDIKMYINCPGGSTYSVLAIYDAMAWVKPDVSTVAFGLAASQGAILLAGGAKGKRFSMPNARIMIHQPQGGCGGTSEDVRRQVNEVMSSRNKIDKMYAAFTGRPLELVQEYTERDYFFSAAEAVEFGLLDGVLETSY